MIGCRSPYNHRVYRRQFTLIHKEGAMSIWFSPDFTAVDTARSGPSVCV